MIDALASAPHYEAHVRPVWEALGPDLRGTFHARPPKTPGPPVLVASYVDAARVRQRAAIYLEHGAGQTYAAGQTSYAGGRGKDNVGLFLSPSERVADLNRKAYPKAEHAVIGCPLLDEWVGYRPQNPEPVIGMAWHWQGSPAEARSAFRHYQNAIPTLPFNVLGHGHPRAIKQLALARFYDQHDIRWTPDFTDVLREADVLVFDNTSAGFMFAALDRPVVVLDAPWYKRAWGGRFWDWADVGVRISEPSRLAWAIAEALHDGPEQAQRRREISHAIYGTVDGNAAQRAAGAVECWSRGCLGMMVHTHQEWREVEFLGQRVVVAA